MKFRSDESGQMLVLTAMCMTMLLGFMALAIDVGLLFRARRNIQIAADAAATAGALDYQYHKSTTSATAAAQAAATANGFTDGSGGVAVTVNTPPVNGPNNGATGFIEAIVSQPVPTFFMGIIRGQSSMNVAARAVAGSPAISDGCFWVTDPHTSDALHLQGNTTINGTNCSIYVNSDSASAVKVTGNSSTFNGTAFDVVGGYTGHNTTPTGITENAAAQSQPYGNLTGPATADCTAAKTSSLTSITTSNMSQVQGSGNDVVCFTKAVTLNNGVSLPGSNLGVMYMFENGVTIATGAAVTIGSGTYNSTTGQFTVTGGATMVLNGGTLNQKSNSVLDIFAPAPGPDTTANFNTNTIAILQPASNPTTPLQVQFGSNNQIIDGIIYAPGVEVYLQDNGGGVTATGVVADTMYIKSSTFNVLGYNGANQSTTPFKVVTLVE